MKEYQFSRPPDGDRSQGWALLAVCWAFVTAALATTILRVWVRMRLTRNIGWDDYNMIIAMVSIGVHYPLQSLPIQGNHYHGRGPHHR